MTKGKAVASFLFFSRFPSPPLRGRKYFVLCSLPPFFSFRKRPFFFPFLQLSKDVKSDRFCTCENTRRSPSGTTSWSAKASTSFFSSAFFPLSPHHRGHRTARTSDDPGKNQDRPLRAFPLFFSSGTFSFPLPSSLRKREIAP